MAHRLAHILDAAARGAYPDPDGKCEVLPSLGAISVMVAFTGHWVIAANVDPQFVRDRYSDGDYSVPMSAAFLHQLGHEIGAEPKTQDVLLVALSAVGVPSIELEPLDDFQHSRVARANRYRRDVRVYTTVDRRGVMILGRGITNRWEVAVEVEPDAHGQGLGRALFDAALRMLPPSTPVWAQVAPGNPASLRSVQAAGFKAVGAEVLFVGAPQLH